MLTNYIRAALRQAKYEILSDDNTYYGEIPEFEGVYANADTLEACREELEEVLEEWIFFESPIILPFHDQIVKVFKAKKIYPLIEEKGKNI